MWEKFCDKVTVWTKITEKQEKGKKIFPLPHRLKGEGASQVEQRMEMVGGGTLLLRQEGPRVRLEAERPSDGRGLYKVWLHGDRGGKLLLGTLVPEGDRLRLSRTLSVGELERAGCWPDFRVEAPLAFTFLRRGEGGGTVNSIRTGWCPTRCSGGSFAPLCHAEGGGKDSGWPRPSVQMRRCR